MVDRTAAPKAPRSRRPFRVLPVEGGVDSLERPAEPRPRLTVLFAPLDVLPIRLQGGLRTLGHGAGVLSVKKNLSVTKG